MSSRRSWLMGLALGAFISIQGLPAANAQSGVPRFISYQGQLTDGTKPVEGLHSFKVTYYDASGATLYSETFTNHSVKNGTFGLMLGSGGPGFPASMSFNEQYFIGVAIDDGPELSPRTQLQSAPFAINAGSVNGISASTTPTPGMLLPLDATAHIDPRVLPTPPAFVSSLNNVLADPTNNLQLVAGPNIQIQPDALNHKITISSVPGANSLRSVIAGDGLVGGGSSGDVILALAPGAIDASHIADGAITGRKFDPFVGGDGLYQDALGNLNVGVDNQTIQISGKVLTLKPGGINAQLLADNSVSTQKLQDGAVTGTKVDPSTVQLRVSGVAAPGTFVHGINQDGSVTTGTVLNDPTLSRSVVGNDVSMGLNLSNSNAWTSPQFFNNSLSTTGLDVTGPTNFHDNTVTGVATPVNPSDAASKAYVDASLSATNLNGDVVGPIGANTINTLSATTGDNVIAALNNGTVGTVNPAQIANGLTNAQVNDDLTINGGSISNSPIDNSPVGSVTPNTGAFTSMNAASSTTGSLSVTGSADFGGNAVTGIGTPSNPNDATNKSYVDAQIATVSPLAGDVAGPNNANLITTSATTGDHIISAVNLGAAGSLAATQIGNGLTDAQVNDNLTVSGGMVDNSPIGSVTPSTGAFTSTSSASSTTGTLSVTGSADFGGTVVTGVATPLANTDAANKAYVDNSITAVTLAGDVSGAPGANTISQTNATGNNIIGAANLGDAGTLNATQIGNGLTDSQVNDNLTINGGSITASPIENSTIGAVTPNTGAFTTVNSTSATTGTLAVSGAADFGGVVVNNVATPIVGSDAANMDYVNAQIAAVSLAGDVTGAPGSNTINASNATGNNIVASVNLADAGTLNATQIGTGLTDAQINDNLTINAGSITATPIENSTIGAVSPNTGSFTTLGATTATAGDLTVTNSANFSNNVISGVATPIVGTDAANMDYVNNQIGAVTLAGDVNGAPGSNTINASNATGNNIVASVNLADAGTLNATQIGIGLTDAQVSDNLTISGGTVDNSPIGSVTPSTGAFTSTNTGSLTVTGAANFSNQVVNGVADPLIASDAASKNYVDNAFTSLSLAGDVSGTLGANTITASNATGNNIVTSVNLADAGTLAATQIGTGLTDAQISDNLTISGGTVDNSPIGSVTPSTGAFTSTNTGSLAVTTSADFGGIVVNNIATPLVGTDAANMDYVNNQIGAVTLAGDVNGAPGSNTINASNATGNNIVTSVNLADAGTLNATQIGIGLTDAQVSDNLTISGGTVDNSPIGSVTPSTGAFTSTNTGSLAVTGSADFGGIVVNNVATPLVGTDAANMAYVNSQIGAVTLAGDVNGAPGSNTINASNATGNNIVASVNLADAGTLAATQIGTGLTDAQVSDNLTISGGTVDNSPIGSVTPSTGAFTSTNTGSLAVTTSADFGGIVVNNIATPLVGTDAANMDYVNNQIGAVTLAGDVNGAPGSNTINASNATGNNIVTSVNLADAGTLAATQIGTGLTDAQISDNLTISGGTVDNSPIGSVTPSTGAFTSTNTGSLAVTGSADFGGIVVNNVATPLVGTDAANMDYVNNQIGAVTLAGDVNGAPGSNTINASNATGNNIVASVNLADAGTLAATQIGTGLTDAQISDNLTISGGTVDNSPIGSVTPSTGAFTSTNTGSLAVTGSADFGGIVVNNVATPLVGTDAANMAYVNSQIGAVTLAGDVNGAPGANTINASNATGNNIVTSVNLADAGTLAATQIGTGLTDAQVSDNLTISGGTVDNSPIGSVTPSTGAFTSTNTGSLAVTASADFGGIVVNNVATPLVGTDAANMAYVNSQIGAVTLAGDVNGAPGSNTINASNATGNNIVTSVNLADAGTLNATQIGTGLTDAQVSDNLTISGGTVDNSPIGSVTPSTGAFTSTNTGSLAVTTSADFGGIVVNNVATPLVGTDAANMAYVNSQIGAVTLAGDVNGAPGSNTINASNATGNNIVTSVNLADAGTLNATQIGTGLTDAQVSDNLTIAGGTVDNSPIGSVTPSTGAFTSTNTGSLAVTTSADFGGIVVNSVATPLVGTDAANMDYVNNQIGAVTLAGDVTGAFGSTVISNTLATGDNIVAAINSATAGTLSADKIANGITDAQVNDDLTINAGVIDNTPIGATTQSTGAFTTLVASTPASGITLGNGASATSISSSATAARSISFADASGTMPVMWTGSVTLVAGTASVAIAGVTAADHVIATRTAFGGTPDVFIVTPGAGTVTVTSNNVLDTSTFDVIVLKK